MDPKTEHPAPARVQIGRSSGSHIIVVVHAREWPDPADADDGNWLATSCEFRLGAFQGRTTPSLRAEELAAFLTDLQGLYATLAGSAVLQTMEAMLVVEVTTSGRGDVIVSGYATSELGGFGHRLSFEISDLDQTDLRPIIDELSEVVERFPPIRS